MKRAGFRYSVYAVALVVFAVAGIELRGSFTNSTNSTADDSRERDRAITGLGPNDVSSAEVPDTGSTTDPLHQVSESVDIATSVPDSISALVASADLGQVQLDHVKKATTIKEMALALLQDEVYARGVSAEVASARAKTIQRQFEADLASTLDSKQMDLYWTLKREGKVGTYAIVVPTGPK